MKKTTLLILLFAISLAVMVAAVGIGSVSVAPADTVKIILNNMFGAGFEGVNETAESIIWKVRFPRSLLAFIAGAGLAVSGVIMQSVLRNPLASASTLGVSSGAALGASVAILFKITVFGFFTLPVFGLVAGLFTVFLALTLSNRLDKSMQNNTIILTGMAFSLFANAMLTVIMSLSREDLQRLIFWQLGSFASKGRQYAAVLFFAVLAGSVMAFRYSREMDILTYGEEQAKLSGVETKRVKLILVVVSALLTGFVTSMVGIIGFLDLFTPHAARKLFGAKHSYVLAASIFLGGTFMVVCDLAARTIASPVELPVGAITSAIGAPFFIYLYFSKRKKAQ